MTVFRQPGVDIKHGIEGIMDITEQPPGPAKASWRLVSARLEILQRILTEFGINDKVWNWQIVFQKLVAPSFQNSNPDVRLQAIECTITFYQIVGPVLRKETQQINDMKPSISDQIYRRMDIIDIEQGNAPTAKKTAKRGAKANPPGLKKKLEQIDEKDELTLRDTQPIKKPKK